MTTALVATLVAGLVSVAMLVELLRRQVLKVKYAALWLAMGVATLVLAVAPGLLDGLASLLGVADPPNLLFFVAILVLLAVTVQLSLELSRMEERIRTLAEHVAMLEHDETTRATSGDDTSAKESEIS